MTTQHPEALRLADELDAVPETGADPQTIQEAAAELRRLHAYCQELEAQVILDCMTHIQNPAPQPSPGWKLRASHGQAPAQAAPVCGSPADLPPLPDPDLRDVGTNPEDIKNFLRGYATEYAKAALAARAPADSVLEDAARLDFLIEQRAYVVSDPDTCPGYWLHFVHKETGKCWVQCDEHPTPRAAIDAARKQGANHD